MTSVCVAKLGSTRIAGQPTTCLEGVYVCVTYCLGLLMLMMVFGGTALGFSSVVEGVEEVLWTMSDQIMHC